MNEKFLLKAGIKQSMRRRTLIGPIQNAALHGTTAALKSHDNYVIQCHMTLITYDD